MSGAPMTRGYAVADITTPATNEFMDTFRGNCAGHVCEAVGRLFRQDHNMGARMVFEDGTAYHPLISAASAADSAEDRPSWSDLVRRVWPWKRGQNVVIILTTDTKKRLWPRAFAGPLGENTPIFIHDSGLCISESRLVNWVILLARLDLIEEVYAAGFSKRAIGDGLLRETKAVAAVGLSRAIRYNRALSSVRCAPEFAPALLIAQKPLAAKEAAKS